MPIKIIFSIIVFSATLLLNGCYGLLMLDIKNGDEALKEKRYYDAAKSYIHAIASYDNGNADAKNKLSGIAVEAYNQKALWAKTSEEGGNMETAYTHYTELGVLSDELQRYLGLTLTAVNTGEKKTKLGNILAEKYYNIAEGGFNRKDYTQAISQYRVAQSYISMYRDSNNKIAESYYQMGISMESQGNYRKASDNYTAAGNTIAGYKDAGKRAKDCKARADEADALVCYYKGKDLAGRQQYAEAINEMKNAQGIVPHFRDSDYWINQYDTALKTKKAEDEYLEGLRYMSEGKYKEALDDFNDALRIMPTFKYAQDAKIRVEICHEKLEGKK